MYSISPMSEPLCLVWDVFDIWRGLDFSEVRLLLGPHWPYQQKVRAESRNRCRPKPVNSSRHTNIFLLKRAPNPQEKNGIQNWFLSAFSELPVAWDLSQAFQNPRWFNGPRCSFKPSKCCGKAAACREEDSGHGYGEFTVELFRHCTNIAKGLVYTYGCDMGIYGQWAVFPACNCFHTFCNVVDLMINLQSWMVYTTHFC